MHGQQNIKINNLCVTVTLPIFVIQLNTTGIPHLQGQDREIFTLFALKMFVPHNKHNQNPPDLFSSPNIVRVVE